MTVSAPGPSTSVVSRPGPSNQDIHQSIKDKNRYYACDKFDYFVGGTGVSDSETDGDDIIVNENKVVDDIVQNLGDEALDGLYYSKSDDDNIDITGEDADDEDKDKERRRGR